MIVSGKEIEIQVSGSGPNPSEETGAASLAKETKLGQADCSELLQGAARREEFRIMFGEDDASRVSDLCAKLRAAGYEATVFRGDKRIFPPS